MYEDSPETIRAAAAYLEAAHASRPAELAVLDI
jgi:hypothetical protein